MRLAVVDANYRLPDDLGITSAWLRWEIEQAGGTLVDSASADVVCVTASCPQNWRDVRASLKRAGMRHGARVVLGGAASFQPAVFDGMVSAVCVGEGRNWIRALCHDGWDAACSLPETWIPGESRAVVPSVEYPWDMPPIRVNGIVRLTASRGCRYRCLFCQTGWETTYRTHPDPARLSRQIRETKQRGERLTILTNDGAEDAVCRFGGHEFVSLRLQNLVPLLPLTRQFSKTVRIGVEGMSERLRVAIGKPAPNDKLLAASDALLRAGIGVRWFFIVGLPGETDADWQEMRQLARECKHFGKSYVWWHWHPFLPKPATPLSVLPFVDEYHDRVEAFKSWFYTGTSFTRRVHLTTLPGYKTRLDHACADMGASEAELRRGWLEHDNPNWRVQYLATPEQLRQTARIYARKIGLGADDRGQ